MLELLSLRHTAPGTDLPKDRAKAATAKEITP